MVSGNSKPNDCSVSCQQRSASPVLSTSVPSTSKIISERPMVMAIISAPAIASLRGSAGDSSHTVLTPEALSPPDVGNAAARLKVPPSRNLYRSGWLLISVWGAPESTPAMFFQRRQHYGNDIAHYFDFAPHRRAPDLALQLRLGLLSFRRGGSRCHHYSHSPIARKDIGRLSGSKRLALSVELSHRSRIAGRNCGCATNNKGPRSRRSGGPDRSRTRSHANKLLQSVMRTWFGLRGSAL